MNTPEERIRGALNAVVVWNCDGSHHKQFLIDQMVRCLTGCPEVRMTNEVGRTYVELGESEEYRAFVRRYTAGEDGPDTYEWDTGIAP